MNLLTIDNKETGALEALLRAAATKYGRPAISTHTPKEKTFPAIFFGFDDVIIMGACSGKHVYMIHKGKARMFVSEEYRDDLEKMAAYAEQQLTPKPAPVIERDEYNAEWLDALARLEADEDERHACEDALYAEHFADVTAQMYAGAM